MGLFGKKERPKVYCIWCGNEITEKQRSEIHYCRDGYICHQCYINEGFPDDGKNSNINMKIFSSNSEEVRELAKRCSSDEIINRYSTQCCICEGSLTDKKYKALDGNICKKCYVDAGYLPFSLLADRLADDISFITIKEIKQNIGDGSRFANEELGCRYVQGLQGLTENGNGRTLVHFKLAEKELFISAKPFVANAESKTYKLPYTRILSIDLISKETYKEKNKSVIGRGIVGGMLFGSVGAMLGGMSGIGTKTITEMQYLFVVAYADKNGEIQNIICDADVQYKLAENFVDYFNRKFNQHLIENEVDKNEEGDILL